MPRRPCGVFRRPVRTSPHRGDLLSCSTLIFLGLFLQGRTSSDPGDLPVHPIDRVLAQYWRVRGVTPAPPCSDSEFQRRVTLDLIGRLPTPAEHLRYSQSQDPRKRQRWVDELLDQRELPLFWGERLASILLGYPQEKYSLGLAFKPMLARWITANLEQARGYDDIVSDLIRSSAQWPPKQGPDAVYPAFGTIFLNGGGRPDGFEEVLGRTARMFLGISLQCAQCHDHPRDRWTQEDFQGMLGFYARLDTAGPLPGKPPRTWAPPVFLDGSTPRDGFRRISELARLVVRPENVRFSRTAANRFWAHFMGQGVIEPLDDLGDGKGALVPGLLEELGGILTREAFHLKPFFRLLVTSEVYQQSSRSDGAAEIGAFTRARVRPLDPEQLFGALTTATRPGPDKNVPEELRSGFIRMIARTSDGEAASRLSEYTAGLEQALRLADSTSPVFAGAKAGTGGMLDRVLAKKLSPPDAIREIYLIVLTRPPEAEELSKCLHHVKEASDLPAGLGEIFWALLNSNEFYFNH